jgi:hypothetical protein
MSAHCVDDTLAKKTTHADGSSLAQKNFAAQPEMTA